MVRAALLFVIALAAGCRTAPGSSGDIESLLKASLANVEKDGRQVIVVPGEKLDPAVLAAARRIRKVVAIQEAETAGETLAANHFRLDKVEISGDTAVVEGWLGPIRKPKPGEILLDCGTGHTLSFERISDAPYWKVTTVGMAVC